MIAGLMALLIRAELFSPGLQIVSAKEQYNQLFTMHGTIMLLLFATPLLPPRDLHRAGPGCGVTAVRGLTSAAVRGAAACGLEDALRFGESRSQAVVLLTALTYLRRSRR
jgi:hypothetical protein